TLHRSQNRRQPAAAASARPEKSNSRCARLPQRTTSLLRSSSSFRRHSRHLYTGGRLVLNKKPDSSGIDEPGFTAGFFLFRRESTDPAPPGAYGCTPGLSPDKRLSLSTPHTQRQSGRRRHKTRARRYHKQNQNPMEKRLPTRPPFYRHRPL